MPIYAYRCDACGHAMDVLQRMSDAPRTDCPACGAAALVKQVTAAGFQLKGSGWYVTDFRGDAKAKAKAESDAPASGDKAAETPGKAGAKPADAPAAEPAKATPEPKSDAPASPSASTPAAAPPPSTT